MIIKCKMCGGDLNIQEGNTVCECEFCGTQQTVPQIDNEKKANLFNRANRLRINAEFDKAATVYASITAEFPEEAEAYWGLCLCKYGIEYVDDPLTGNKIPTCHRTLPESIMDDSDFDQACENADSISKRLYREEAKTIDKLQQDILNIVASEEPFDVFICYKETDDHGERTEDSVLAQDIYDFLTEKGLKVFFARITLEDKLGKQYEPYIYAALHSAKVMLAVGTNYEYFDAVWVKNEWARYLDMMRTDKSKTLIPCFKGIDAYDMPREFKNLQALDMGKIGWKQDLLRGIKKLTAKEEQPKQEIIQTVVSVGANVENLMKRVRLFMEDGDYTNAKDYIEKVLDENAEYAPAYIAKVCIALELRREEELAEAPYIYDNNMDWKKAIRFADKQQREKYESYFVSSIIKSVKQNISGELTEDQCDGIIKEMEKYSRYNQVTSVINEIRSKKGELIKKRIEEQNRMIEEENKRREEQIRRQEELKRKFEEEKKQHLLKVEKVEEKIKQLEENFASRLESIKNTDVSLKDINVMYNSRKRDLEKQLQRSKERTQELLSEELQSNGRNSGKKKSDIISRRKQEQIMQDTLRKQLKEAEINYITEYNRVLEIESDKKGLIYSIAKIYYENELYAEALKEYKKIPDYKDVGVILSSDLYLREISSEQNSI